MGLTMKSGTNFRQKLSKAAFIGLLFAIIAAFLAIMAGTGSRLQWWHFGTGFTLLKWGVYIALAALVLAVAGVLAGGKRVWRVALAAMSLSVTLITVPAWWLNKARSVPAIHDITTDTQNPPQFDAGLALRQNAANSVEYAGEEIASQQRAAYPDIQPVVTSVSPQAAYDAALEVAQKLGWDIVGQSPQQGRIEAVDTTFWFGFKDDVVIRISPHDGGSHVDIRSVSRVGRSDVGANAARIRAFIRLFKERVN